MRRVRLEKLNEGAEFFVVGKTGTLRGKGSGSASVSYGGESTNIALGTMVQVPGIEFVVITAKTLGPLHSMGPLHEQEDLEPFYVFVGEGAPLYPPAAKDRTPKGALTWFRKRIAAGDKVVNEAIDAIVDEMDAHPIKLCCYCGVKKNEDCHGHAIARLATERRIWRILNESSAG